MKIYYEAQLNLSTNCLDYLVYLFYIKSLEIQYQPVVIQIIQSRFPLLELNVYPSALVSTTRFIDEFLEFLFYYCIYIDNDNLYCLLPNSCYVLVREPLKTRRQEDFLSIWQRHTAKQCREQSKKNKQLKNYKVVQRAGSHF